PHSAISSRKAQTVIELRDGQSFAMAGLLQTVNAKTIEQLPWIGQVPVLGALFRSTSFQKQETDLVVVVTPRLVQPASPGEQLHSPLDQTRSPDDVELFALGLLEVDNAMLRSFKEGQGISGPYGHIIDIDTDNADARPRP
ncbi:type II and III secretion system protein family protein, partial [Aurantimonas sp. LRZ36]|nr:type II and III secretion system protein family protein [Aurantimonas marianensis]